MSNEFARSFRDLIVYRKAREVAKAVFCLSKAFPKEEAYSLTSQIRRSSRSVGAQVAEAWAKRRYPNHFAAKLTDADGEKNETEHWLGVALACDYVTPEQVSGIIDKLAEIGRMLQSMIARADDFKGDEHGYVREDSAVYDSTSPLKTEH